MKVEKPLTLMSISHFIFLEFSNLCSYNIFMKKSHCFFAANALGQSTIFGLLICFLFSYIFFLSPSCWCSFLSMEPSMSRLYIQYYMYTGCNKYLSLGIKRFQSIFKISAFIFKYIRLIF